MAKTLLKTIFDELFTLQKVKNQFEFGNMLGYTSGYMTEAIKKADIPTKMQKKLSDVFGISIVWLASGGKEGSMYGDEIKVGKPKEVIALGKQLPLRLKPEEYAEAFGNWPGLPMYNVPITASFIQTYRDESIYTPQYYLHDPRFKDCNFGVIITGDSMYPEIRHGDFVVCKEIEDKSFIVYGDIYYITAKNGLETCKYVHGNPNDEDKLLLVPRNDSIPASPISKLMLDRLFKVKGIVRGY